MRRERSLLLDTGTLGTSSAVPAFEVPSPQLLWLPPDQEGTLGLMTASPYVHGQVHGQAHGQPHGQKSKAESVRFSTVLPLWSSATSNGRGFKGTFGDSLSNSDRCHSTYRRPTSTNETRFANKEQPLHSKYRGVYATPFGTWRAELELSGRRISLGTFISEEDAAECFDKVTVQCFGSTDIDCLNFHVPPALAAAWLSEPLPKNLISALRQAEMVENKQTYRDSDLGEGGGKKKMKR